MDLSCRKHTILLDFTPELQRKKKQIEKGMTYKRWLSEDTIPPMTWSYPRQTVAVVTVGQAAGHVNGYVISFMHQPPLTALVPERGRSTYRSRCCLGRGQASPDGTVAVRRETQSRAIYFQAFGFWGKAFLRLFIFNLTCHSPSTFGLVLYCFLSIYKPLVLLHTSSSKIYHLFVSFTHNAPPRPRHTTGISASL